MAGATSGDSDLANSEPNKELLRRSIQLLRTRPCLAMLCAFYAGLHRSLFAMRGCQSFLTVRPQRQKSFSGQAMIQLLEGTKGHSGFFSAVAEKDKNPE
jgi:hypothetical protein